MGLQPLAYLTLTTKKWVRALRLTILYRIFSLIYYYVLVFRIRYILVTTNLKSYLIGMEERDLLTVRKELVKKNTCVRI